MKTKTTSFLICSLVIVFCGRISAQNVGINTTGTPPNSSAILDLSNTANLAFLAPQVILTSATVLAPVPGPGPAGLLVYNTSASVLNGLSGVGYYYWTGGQWDFLSIATASTAWNLTGNGGTNPAINYAGTSDPEPFIIKTSAVERMRFLTGGGAGIGTPTPQSAVDVNGNMSIGSYAGVNAAPANGVIISGTVGIGTSTPSSSAILDLTNAITNKGFLLPNMTTVLRNAIVGPARGLMIFNTTTGCINFWTGFAWENVACPTCTGPAATPGAITGNTTPVISTTGNVYSIAPVAGASSYTWSLLPASAGTSITAGQGTTAITVSFGAALVIYTICVHDSNACGVSAATCINATTINCTHSNYTWYYSGGLQTWVVPTCVTHLTVSLAGAAGGTGGWTSLANQDAGGNGGSVSGVLTVAGGTTLNLYVGQVGGNGTTSAYGVGGYNGGGNGYYYPGSYWGGGGGGATDIRIGGTALANRVVVAGGGGGAGFNYFACCNYEQGGPGGASTGGAGYSDLIQGGTGPGGGGTQIAGGGAGTWGGYCTGNPGVIGVGGNDCTSSYNAGGGGGGGYYGGGAGVWSGGGGGSNYAGGLTTTTSNSQGTQTGSGFITIQW